MLAAVRDLLADGMNPIKRVEKEERFSGKRIRGCGEQDTAILGLAHPVNSNGSAGEVAGEFFQPLRLVVSDELLRIDRKPGRIPLQQPVHELLGETLRAV